MVMRKNSDREIKIKHEENIRSFLRKMAIPDLDCTLRLNTQIDMVMFREGMQKLEFATVQDVLILHHQARSIANKVQMQSRSVSKSKFIQWIEEAIQDGAKGAHRWTNEENLLAPLRMQTKD